MGGLARWRGLGRPHVPAQAHLNPYQTFPVTIGNYLPDATFAPIVC